LGSEFLETTACSFLSNDFEIVSTFFLSRLLLGFKLKALLFSILNILGRNSTDMIQYLFVVERDSLEVLRHKLGTAFKGSSLLGCRIVLGIEVQGGHLLDFHDPLVVISKAFFHFSGDFLTADVSCFEFAEDLAGIKLFYVMVLALFNFLVVCGYTFNSLCSHLQSELFSCSKLGLVGFLQDVCLLLIGLEVLCHLGSDLFVVVLNALKSAGCSLGSTFFSGCLLGLVSHFELDNLGSCV